jgi:hypothetical protein
MVKRATEPAGAEKPLQKWPRTASNTVNGNRLITQPNRSKGP